MFFIEHSKYTEERRKVGQAISLNYDKVGLPCNPFFFIRYRFIKMNN